VTLAIGAYVGWFAGMSVQVQDGYGAPGFDMGIFDQGTWLLAHFKAPFVTVMGRDLFGDHTSFVMLLAVPLYWIWDEPQTLLVLQTVLLAAAAVPVYSLARRRMGTGIATVCAVAFLLNPALQNGNLEQFHPECFLVFFLAAAVWAAVEWHPRLLAVSVTSCLLTKEDAALLVIPLAIWVAVRRDRAWGAVIAGASLAYMAFAYEVVIRFLLGTTTFYYGRIPFGGLANLLGEPFTHPLRFARYILSGYRPFYMWQTVASFGGAFLIAPELAAVAVLGVLENVLSTFPYMQQIEYHYSLAAVPVLAMGSVYGLSRVGPGWRRRAGAGWLLGSAVAACCLWGLTPLSRTSSYPHASPTSPAVEAVNRALASVPAGAVVSAAYPFVSHLDHRVACYQWPTPFRATAWHLYTQEGEYLPVAATVRYLVVPADLSGPGAVTFARIADQFRLVAHGGGVAVYERDRPAPVDPEG
jgi:uncharacterized membrane protein